MHVLSLNRGSSSLKLAMYSCEGDGDPRLLVSGNLERIGEANAALVLDDPAGDRQRRVEVDAPGRCREAEELVDWLGARLAIDQADAIGHRVVHGGPRYIGPDASPGNCWPNCAASRRSIPITCRRKST